MRRVVVAAVVVCAMAGAVYADDLQRAQELAWAKEFVAAEALYRAILIRQPDSREAQLGLARVVLWQERYAEASRMFRAIQPADIETIEGLATAAYWSGDLREARRGFRHALTLDPQREFSRRSLGEIDAMMRSSQRLAVVVEEDDQPVDRIRIESEAVHFSDPLTRWSVLLGAYRMDAGLIGTRRGELLSIANETTWKALTVRASLGMLKFPDGARRPVGSLALRHRSLELRLEEREELAAATSLRTHATSRTTALRWDHDKDWVAAAEVSHKRYFDDNEGFAAVLYGVAPVLRRGPVTVWAGAAAAARDTDESRFTVASVSSTRQGDLFRYSWRGEHSPYWSPRGLREARAVLAVEYRTSRGSVKFHGDAGIARDQGRAFSPAAGSTPLPTSSIPFEFDRSYRPYRLGITVGHALVAGYRLEIAAERSVTIDYRSTILHASLVRQR